MGWVERVGRWRLGDTMCTKFEEDVEGNALNGRSGGRGVSFM